MLFELIGVQRLFLLYWTYYSPWHTESLINERTYSKLSATFSTMNDIDSSVTGSVIADTDISG
jgi:hypothetical protein